MGCRKNDNSSRVSIHKAIQHPQFVIFILELLGVRLPFSLDLLLQILKIGRGIFKSHLPHLDRESLDAGIVNIMSLI